MADHGILKHVLDLKPLLHSPFEKSIIERSIEYFKDRTENFDDYYPCVANAAATLLLSLIVLVVFLAQ
jgi:hypothetical protein